MLVVGLATITFGLEAHAANSEQKGDTVTFWNATGIDTVLATPLGPRGAPLGSRAMAMMHVAMADAVTSIHPSYKPYAIRIRGHRNANEIAAAASAAYGVLVRLFPARQAQLDAALAESLAQVQDGEDEGPRHCAWRRGRCADRGAPRERWVWRRSARTRHPSASGSGNPIRAPGPAPSCPGRR